MSPRRTRARRLARAARWPLIAASVLGASACAVFTPLPEPIGLEDRLSALPTRGLPLERPVTISWDAHQIPFVEAETDDDAAFVLGLVHAHLRLGQLETARRLSQGRVAEMAGPIPVVLDLDHALRTFGFGRTAPAVLAAMPDRSRRWLERFTDGINHYLTAVKTLPHDFAVLGLERTPWTPEEVLTIGRLAGADVTWLAWVRLLGLRDRPDFPDVLRRALHDGALAPSSAEVAADDATANPGLERALGMLAALLESRARGSNSLALAGTRTASGAPMIASDPHLGVSQPNLWLIAGVKSPGLHVVGLMPVGLPLFALGRTPDIAWGGTNMRAASSDLVDVSGLPDSVFIRETHDLGVRFWFDTTRESRLSPHGPVLSDAPLLPFQDGEHVALRWVGHTPTDEITALLDAARARTFREFRAALEPFGVSAQSLVYADRHGTIGLAAAARLPRRDPDAADRLIHDPATVERWWADMATAADLPVIENPPQGFVASANNPPGPSLIPLGWFFSAPDRVDRLSSLVRAASEPWTVDALARMQTDTYSPSAVALRDHLAARLGARLAGDVTWDTVAAWDGRYDADSRGALAYQALYVPLATALWRDRGWPDHEWQGGGGAWRVLAVLQDLDDGSLEHAVRAALSQAAEPLATHRTWGDIHQMAVTMPLANIPLVGGRYRFDRYPVGGGQETLMKTAHAETLAPHTVRYGAQARHISDLSDPDENHFVLLGGQDGWINSTTHLDQIGPWRAGTLVRVPLTPEAVAANAAVVQRLTPAER
ncbi:penicillin acylase family protein [Roseospira visakhapatnamensis]|uniref:Penicillin amidase n=1 Tax=Roseospira visakhapatnamensis TaxID=390880 RepID=A0A7W6W8T8_9PROT|nr:penicillin acylase family protein [Roseospira visakhapatnamensis]MBB4265370.1 penicillin amidase [Roseospira visakhapatnamensis]